MAARHPKDLPTRKQLAEAFDYDPESGVLTWRYRPDKLRNWNSRCAGKPAGCVGSDGYIQICLNSQSMKAHRAIWVLVYGSWPREEIDHINGCTGDNRLSNLREAAHVENCWNVPNRRNNTSGHKGVSWNTWSGKWVSHIRDGQKKVFLGRFRTLKEASAAYREAAHKLHGEFARVD